MEHFQYPLPPGVLCRAAHVLSLCRCDGTTDWSTDDVSSLGGASEEAGKFFQRELSTQDKKSFRFLWFWGLHMHFLLWPFLISDLP